MLEQRIKIQEVGVAELFENLRSENVAIQGLDPLELDIFFKTLFLEMIRNGDRSGLENLLFIKYSFTPKDSNEAKAFLRDIGMVMAALKRIDNSWEPDIKVQTRLIEVAKTVNEPPRDSVFSYGPRNPAGERRRMFIGSEQEVLFINSFSEGMLGLDICLENLLLCYEESSLEKIAELLERSVGGFDKMVDAIVMVRRKIKPEYFTGEMRPFFDPIVFGGQSFSAPGGAQMPILIIDSIMWAKNLGQAYTEYSDENFRYIPEKYLKIFEFCKKLESIEKYILSKKDHTGNSPESLKKALTALKKLANNMITFRVPHFKVAEDNFKLRPGGAVGSGGYTPEVLALILSETRKYRDIIVQYESRT